MDRHGLADEPEKEGYAQIHAPGRAETEALATLDALAPGTFANCLYRSSLGLDPPPTLLARLPQVRWVVTDDHPLTWIDPDHHLRVHDAWIDACEGCDRIGRTAIRTVRPLCPNEGRPTAEDALAATGPPGWYQMTIVDLTGVEGLDMVVVALVPAGAADGLADEIDSDGADDTPAPSWFRGTTSFRLRLDAHGAIKGGTLNVAEVLGRPLVDLLGHEVEELAHPDDLDAARTAWDRLTSDDDAATEQLRVRIRMADGSWRWFDSTSWNVLGVPQFGAVITEFRDVHHQVEAEQANETTSRAHARLVRVFDEVDDIVMVGRLGGGLVYLNRAAVAAFGEHPLDRVLVEGVDTDLRTFVLSVIQPALQQLEPWIGDLEIHADGEPRTMATTVTPVNEPDQDDIFFGVIMRDVTADRHHARSLASQARRDPLTGLPNRLALTEHLDACRHGAPDRTVSVCFIDLDNLKIVNDGLGHSAGDRLLRAVGAQLLTRPGLVARFGGDEFVVVLHDHSQEEAVEEAEELLAAIRRVEVLGVVSSVTASVGVATSRREQLDPEAVIRDADAAMYVAKRTGRARVVHFDETMRAVAARRFVLESSLREALAHDHLEVHFQPVVSLATGQVSGLEALARWHAAVPSEFIPVAEDSGLIVPLGVWALRSSVAALAQIVATDPSTAGLRMGVNVSGHQLLDPTFPDLVLRALAEHGVDPHHLTLELTESVLIDPRDEIEAVLRRLRAAGVSLALDDFGSGYSSLGYLRRYPIDVLKLDNTYTQTLLHDPGTQVIVEAVVTMANRLGLRVVAEGVETEEQLAAVRELGIDWAQGYLLGRPAPLDQTIDTLAAWPALDGG